LNASASFPARALFGGHPLRMFCRLGCDKGFSETTNQRPAGALPRTEDLLLDFVAILRLSQADRFAVISASLEVSDAAVAMPNARCELGVDGRYDALDALHRQTEIGRFAPDFIALSAGKRERKCASLFFSFSPSLMPTRSGLELGQHRPRRDDRKVVAWRRKKLDAAHIAGEGDDPRGRRRMLLAADTAP